MSGRRLALVIANGEYDHDGLERLTSTTADAAALVEVLGDPAIAGFEVEVLRDAAAHEVLGAIEDRLSDAHPDDLVVLHFSGHGLKDEAGALFLAARNTRPDRLGSTAVAADFVQRAMNTCRARRLVLLLDCCYGGAFGRGVRVRASGSANVLDAFPAERIGGGRGRAVISAASSMEFAFEGTRLSDSRQSPSVFTDALVGGLRSGAADLDGDGLITLDELYHYVFDRVREANPRQSPTRRTDLQGDLVLATSVLGPREATPRRQAPTTRPLPESQAWSSGQLGLVAAVIFQLATVLFVTSMALPMRYAGTVWSQALDLVPLVLATMTVTALAATLLLLAPRRPVSVASTTGYSWGAGVAAINLGAVLLSTAIDNEGFITLGLQVGLAGCLAALLGAVVATVAAVRGNRLRMEFERLRTGVGKAMGVAGILSASGFLCLFAASGPASSENGWVWSLLLTAASGLVVPPLTTTLGAVGDALRCAWTIITVGLIARLFVILDPANVWEQGHAYQIPDRDLYGLGLLLGVASLAVLLIAPAVHRWRIAHSH